MGVDKLWCLVRLRKRWINWETDSENGNSDVNGIEVSEMVNMGIGVSEMVNMDIGVSKMVNMDISDGKEILGVDDY